MMTDRCPGLAAAGGVRSLHHALSRGRSVVWLPGPGATPCVEASWRVTSDSLALWLAGRLAARRVLLVKSVPRLPPDPDVVALVDAGVVDPAFPEHLDVYPGEAR